MTTGKRDITSYMDRNWEKYPPRNAPEKVALFYKKMFADPIVKLKGIYILK